MIKKENDLKEIILKVKGKEETLSPIEYYMMLEEKTNEEYIVIKKPTVERMHRLLDLKFVKWDKFIDFKSTSNFVMVVEYHCKDGEYDVIGIGSATPESTIDSISRSYFPNMAYKRAKSDAVVQVLSTENPSLRIYTDFDEFVVRGKKEQNNKPNGNNTPNTNSSPSSNTDNNSSPVFDTNEDDISNYKLIGGSNRGKSLKELYLNNKPYLKWLLNDENSKGYEAKAKLQEFIKKYNLNIE